MAHNSQEIEIKTPISRKAFLRILKCLRKNTKFIKFSKLVDTYYTPFGRLFLKPKYPCEWLSLRQRNGKVTINYKHWYPEGKEVTTHCDEYETDLGNINQFRKILTKLKFEKLVTVNKNRQIFVKDSLEIALDHVKYLGYYIEIESLSNSGGVDKTRENILNFAKELGVNKITNVPGGYAAALMRKRKMHSS